MNLKIVTIEDCLELFEKKESQPFATTARLSHSATRSRPQRRLTW